MAVIDTIMKIMAVLTITVVPAAVIRLGTERPLMAIIIITAPPVSLPMVGQPVY